MADYDRSATGPLPVDAGPRRAESIFDLSPEDFRASLGEMQAMGHDTDALMRQYRAVNSPFAPINNAAAAQQQGLADSGRRPVLGGLLSKPEGAIGMDALAGLEFEGLGGLLGAGQAIGQGLDAPAAAAQGLIPQADVNMEALNTAGMAMGAGGAATAPAGALRTNSFRTHHASPISFDNFDLGKVGTGEGGALLGRGVNLTDNPDVARYYQQELAGGDGFLYDVDVNASANDFLDFNTPISSQSQSVRNALDGAGLPLGELPREFRWNGANGSVFLGANKRFGSVTEDRGAYTARVGSQEVGRFSSPEAAGEALMRVSDERGIVARGDDIRGSDAFDALGGRGVAEGELLRAGIPGAKMSGDYNAGPSTDFSVYDDRVLSIRNRNGERINANASQSGGLLGAGLSEAQRQARDILDMRAAGNARSVTDDMMGRADDQYMFNNTPLPMDEASRLARADQRLPDDQYHATMGDFQAFQPSQTGLSGRGVYSGDDSMDIESYASAFHTTDEGLNLIPIRTPAFERYARNIDWQDTADADPDFPDHGTVQQTIDGFRRTAETMEGRGFPGVKSQEGERVTFSPTNIRSRFARFDPEFSHLSNLSAANASPTAGLLASGAQEQDKPLPFMEMLRGLLR